ncbi:hypothetical protein AB833_32610 [Chromatiales bacterium (ex Bugula neritina AB1)]|nr:hypothetical protein AB833_32610 [Chromatiales bacterium (ex Bugula neritina AB1)]
MKKITTLNLTTLTCALSFSTHLYAADLVVYVATVEKAEGKLSMAVYDNEADFSKTLAFAQQLPAVEGEMQFIFTDLAAGEYAVMVFHDINDNGKLDTNLLGMPNEPWGASLQGKSLFGPPGWSDTRFNFSDDGLSVTITLK